MSLATHAASPHGFAPPGLPVPRARDLRGAFGLPGEAAALPPELAFLAGQGVAAGVLRVAAAAAAAAGVTGEAALLACGFAEERYFRLLARHLGVPFLERALPLDRAARRDSPNRSGFALLAPNPDGLHAVLAPSGEELRGLLLLHRTDPGAYRFALTTPRRFEALLRHHDGAALVERSASGLAAWDGALSARGGASAGQKMAAFAAALLFGFALGADPACAWTALAVLLFTIFAAAVLQRLLIVAASCAPRPEPEAPRLPDRDLPVFTVVVPLYREAGMLAQIVRNLDALDYPRAKLDIKIMLEASDAATVAAAARMSLPFPYDVIVLRDGRPRTKPRALNAALETARGALVVVYDAEDRPDPGQLRAAAARFAAAGPDLACLQARLTVDHVDEAWITRMFALDYAALFHCVKPGLAALGLPVALGGTSNHFRVAALRRVGLWDAWNVTEDIDLGYRLARFGYAVGSLDSDTFEEAPLTLGRWMPQRARWLKGWMVTLIVHSRDPRRLIGDLGWRRGLSVAVSLSGTVLSCLLGPPLLGLAALEGCYGVLFRPETAGWWFFVGASAALMAGGVVAAVWPAAAGACRMGRPDLVPWLATLPLYLVLLSAAAWRALVELLRDPQGWNKTEHGFARARGGQQALAREPAGGGGGAGAAPRGPMRNRRPSER